MTMPFARRWRHGVNADASRTQSGGTLQERGATFRDRQSTDRAVGRDLRAARSYVEERTVVDSPEPGFVHLGAHHQGLVVGDQSHLRRRSVPGKLEDRTPVVGSTDFDEILPFPFGNGE